MTHLVDLFDSSTLPHFRQSSKGTDQSAALGKEIVRERKGGVAVAPRRQLDSVPSLGRLTG